MKYFIKNVLIWLLMAVVIAGCNKAAQMDEEDGVDNNAIEIPPEGRDIPLMEYFLTGTHCEWFTANCFEPLLGSNDFVDCVNDSRNKLTLIKSKNELEKYIECSENNGFPDIDFSKHTLLLAQGFTFSGISKIDNSLKQYAANDYSLMVNISLNAETFAESWNIAFVIDKLSEESKVQLIVTHDGVQPLSLNGTRWKLEGIVDTKTGEMRELVPTASCDGISCLKIEFFNDVSARGYDFKNCAVRFDIVNDFYFHLMPPGFITDGNENRIVSCEHIAAFSYPGQRSYLLNEKELKIFFDYRNSYLLYKPIDQ